MASRLAKAIILMTPAQIFSANHGCDVGKAVDGPRRIAFNGRVKRVQIVITDAAENLDPLVSLKKAIRIAMALR